MLLKYTLTQIKSEKSTLNTGFKTILHKKCRSGKNSEGPAENSWVLDLCYVQQNENIFQKV
jgi:hypothetical protein